MRLENISTGHALPQKLTLGLIRLASRKPVPDVVRLLMYRPDYFGRHFSALVQDVLRGPSEWSIYERELFASYTSKVNDCEF